MRAAIYVRQSLDRSGQALAVARQEVECRELAQRNGWEVVRVYADNDTSATARKPRPAWTELLADLRTGQHDVLVCWHTDRLYRRLRDLVDLVELAETRSLRIAAVKSGDVDLSSPAGRMLAGMLGHAARYEVEQKGARQVAANRARAKDGQIGWTRRPYGYDKRGSEIVVVRAEAKELRAAAARVLAGETLTSIIRDMNARGLSTSTGGNWTVTALRRLLVSPRHAGRAVYKGEDYGAAKAKAIFAPDTSDRLRAILNDPRRRTAPESTNVKHLLSGLVTCGKCGGTMYASPAGSPTAHWLVYRCRTQHLARRLDLVDEVVEGVIIARLSRPDAVKLLAADVDVDRLRADVVEYRDRRDGLAALLGEGLLSTAAARTQAQTLTDKIGALERQIADALGDGPASELVGADDVAAAWEALTLAKKRTVIKTLVTVTILPAGKGARFDPASVDIQWRT